MQESPARTVRWRCVLHTPLRTVSPSHSSSRGVGSGQGARTPSARAVCTPSFPHSKKNAFVSSPSPSRQARGVVSKSRNSFVQLFYKFFYIVFDSLFLQFFTVFFSSFTVFQFFTVFLRVFTKPWIWQGTTWQQQPR